jgi:hypothetical protein
MVEAAGVEPASGNSPHRLLHTYPEFSLSPLKPLSGWMLEELSCYEFRLIRNKQPIEAILLIDALSGTAGKTREDVSLH